MQQAGYHHANALASKVTQDIEEKLQERDQQMLAILQNIPSLAELNSSSSSSTESEPRPTQVAASVTSDQTQLAILQLLREIQLDLKKSSGNNARGNGTNRRRQNRKTPDDKTTPQRADVSHYCWTHGAWNHSSNKCRFKAQGHQDEATFENKMGGSCAYCK